MRGFLFDTGVWLAAVLPAHPAHALAQSALDAATPKAPAVFCRFTESSFLRLLTTPAVLKLYDAGHMTNRKAIEVLRLLLSRPNIGLVSEPEGIRDVWHRLAARDTASPKVWMDAYLAAFSMCADLRLVTLDADFKAYEDQSIQLQLLRPD